MNTMLCKFCKGCNQMKIISQYNFFYQCRKMSNGYTYPYLMQCYEIKNWKVDWIFLDLIKWAFPVRKKTPVEL